MQVTSGGRNTVTGTSKGFIDQVINHTIIGFTWQFNPADFHYNWEQTDIVSFLYDLF